MLNKIREFSKGKLAGILVGIITIPFVFWGMGSVFSGGNTNSLVKINNYNISTKDFVEHLNKLNIERNYIKENIDDNVLEELLNELISESILNIEIKDLNFHVSEKILAQAIKNHELFKDSNNKFSRVKYEKFLLEKNTNAGLFEENLKQNQLKKNLFSYISGGIKSPYFQTNKIYIDQNKKIEVSYLNLNNYYKKKDEFTETEINEYIRKNEEDLKKDVIDISYVKIVPNNLIQEDEFNEEFFSKIDVIENEILNGSTIKQISSKFNLELINEKNLTSNEIDNSLLKEIYDNRNENKIQLIDKNDFYLLYEINNIKSIIPKDISFNNLVRDRLYNINKFDFNKNLLAKIKTNKFNKNDFENLAKNNDIKNIVIKSVKDNNLFTVESMKFIYSIPKNKFSLLEDINGNINLTYIENIYSNNIALESDEYSKYLKVSNLNIKSNLYRSYDYLVNKKYKIKINQKTLDRIKNNFR